MLATISNLLRRPVTTLLQTLSSERVVGSVLRTGAFSLKRTPSVGQPDIAEKHHQLLPWNTESEILVEEGRRNKLSLIDSVWLSNTRLPCEVASLIPTTNLSLSLSVSSGV